MDQPTLGHRPSGSAIGPAQLTVICLFVTFVVLRSLLGAGKYGTPNQDLEEIRNQLIQHRDGSTRTMMQLTATKLEASSEVEGDVSPRRAAVLNSADNNEGLNQPHGKRRILMVSGSQPKPCDNPKGDDFILKNLKNKRPFFTDMKFELPLDSYENYNMVVHGWYNMIYEKKSWVGLNTGSYWMIVVENFEKMMEKYRQGLGDERWPFVTHFVGCKPWHGSSGDYAADRCAKQMERAYNFADNQVLEAYGYVHPNLQTVSVEKVEKVEVEREAIGMRHTNLRGGSQ
ncbi:hypothetical protein R1sor_026286 [Riccia sorocarpa]|uniref:Uncharacterized protein n=1 Tax=Riccia sorocarpa TaxID=122646 RepID=A0ABD3GAZ8_9MARC